MHSNIGHHCRTPSARLIFSLLAVALLVGSSTLPFVAAQTPLSPGAINATGAIAPLWPKNLSQHGWPTNLVVVNTAGVLQGALSSNINANLTDIKVLNVPASTPGFTLHDPIGRLVFSNQPSAADGTVTFWHVNFYQGAWVITRQTALGPTSVAVINTVNFGSAYSVSPTEASNNYTGTNRPAEGSVQNPNPQGVQGCETDYKYQVVDDKWAWTPLLIAHAPYGGAGTADASWSHDVSFWISDMGMESDQSTTSHISTSDGATTGDFQTAHWADYYITDMNGCDPMSHYAARVIEWGSAHNAFPLQGSNTKTDADDATSVDNLLFFDTRYRYFPDSTYQNSGNGVITYGTASATLVDMGAQMDFSVGPVSFQGAGFKVTDGASTMYSYTLNPDAAATWQVQHLHHDGEWASCRSDLVDCTGTGAGSSGSGNTPPPAWTYCASAGGSCTFAGTYDVAFGRLHYYALKSGVQQGIPCTSDAFGWDPNPGRDESCYDWPSGSDSTIPNGWRKCANEGDTYQMGAGCDAQPGGSIAYGAWSNFVVMTNVTGRYDCTNQEFGHDPSPGYQKTCYADP